MNQELMTLDFWQDTVIYEGKTFPVGTLACDALNVPADTIAKMNEQCEKINLLLGMLNAGQDASALFPMAREATLTMLSILSKTPPFSYMNISQHRERIEKVFTADNALKYVEFAIKAATDFLQFEEVPKYTDAMMLQRYTAVFGHLAYSLGDIKPQCLILQKNQTAMKQTAPQRDSPKCSAVISHLSSPSRRVTPGCLLRTTLFSMWLPSVLAKIWRSSSNGCTMYPLWGCFGLISLRACVSVMHQRNAGSAASGF